jgi:uracil-DNA glycosylase family 4
MVPDASMPDPRALHAAALLFGQAARAGLDRVAIEGREAAPSRHAPAPTSPTAGTFPAADAALAQIALEIAACTRCPLAATRGLTVPGEGAPRARLMLVGEGPGAEEDRTGRPFVGAAGQQLDKILAGGMGLRREEVFIANVVKCRPPGNRDPAPEEAAACTPFLERQIAAVQPELLLALGRHAAQQLTGSSAPLSSLRGRIHARPSGPPVLVTFHPAYLLRNPAAKRDCWEDVQRAIAHLGLHAPAAGTQRETESGNRPLDAR